MLDIYLGHAIKYIKMGDRVIPLNHDALAELLKNPTILRLVIVVNLASLSILELLEYNFSRKDVSRALAKGVIKFYKSSSVSPAPEQVMRSFTRLELQETITLDY